MNLSTSVLARLGNLSLSSGKTKQYLIDRFTQERFLYRLSVSTHRDKFVLKGGLLLTALMDSFYRATRDVDLRAYIEKSIESVHDVLVEILSIAVDDGVRFDTEKMKIQPIKAQGNYGFRVTATAYINRTQSRLQVDLSFDDVLTLPKAHFVYPILLQDLPAPDLRAYSTETVIAEKLEAIAVLDDDTNSRLKDYDDILELAGHTRFEASTLWLAVTETFEQRGTELSLLWPSISAGRASAREAMYASYRRRLEVNGAQRSFATCLKLLRTFLGPLQAFNTDGVARTWDGGVWTTTS